MESLMKEHFTEADLLDTYYTQPGESMPVMMHLASCADCAAKYQRLDRKLREAAVCHPQKQETFWATQRQNVMARIGSQERRLLSHPALKIAAAAAIAFVLSGVLMYRPGDGPDPMIPTLPDLQQVEEQTVPSDPWQSDELKEFETMVQWESWIAEPRKNGGRSS